MFHVYHSNCSELELVLRSNSSSWLNPYTKRDAPKSEYAFFIILLAVLRATGAVANFVSLCIFLLKPDHSLRLKLVTLSFAEVLLCSASFTRQLIELITTRGIGVSQENLSWQLAYDFCSWITYGSLLARNWIVVFISVSKCDALIRPIKSRSKGLCHQRWQVTILISIVLFSAIFALFYASLAVHHFCPLEVELNSPPYLRSMTAYRYTVPVNNSSLTTLSPLPSKNMWMHLIHFPLGGDSLDRLSDVFFVFQSILPIIGVLVPCLVILGLLRLRTRQSLFADVVNGSTNSNNIRMRQLLGRHTDRATLLCLALAGTFVPLEFPALVANSLFRHPLMGHISNCCVAVDSIANFFLYSGLSPPFQSRIKSIADPCTKHATQNPNGIDGGPRGRQTGSMCGKFGESEMNPSCAGYLRSPRRRFHEDISSNPSPTIRLSTTTTTANCNSCRLSTPINDGLPQLAGVPTPRQSLTNQVFFNTRNSSISTYQNEPLIEPVDL